MTKAKPKAPKPRLPRGLQDIDSQLFTQQISMVTQLAALCEAHGFCALDTPALEYADVLGKFLPDAERPNEGVFALLDDDEQWLSLRYDLTAPLARYVAAHYDRLPKPFRRYQWGWVWRNEKPGLGRFRQFMQFDVDTVGASGAQADVEMCQLAADAMEDLGIARGDYVLRVNNRKILDGILLSLGLNPDDADYEMRRLTILRAMDKLDRLGVDAIRLLLGAGRKDESGDFTKGAGLGAAAIDKIMDFLQTDDKDRQSVLNRLATHAQDKGSGAELVKIGLQELAVMDDLLTQLSTGAERVLFDPSIVRGLDYYTGPVFEISLNMDAKSQTGDAARIGAIGGGGRYDGLVERFKGVAIPATGISIGISRLMAAREAMGAMTEAEQEAGKARLVVVLIMDKTRLGDMLALVQQLRKAGIRAELYMGDGGMKAQLRYADIRGAALALIEGEDELAKGVITIKDLALGRQKAAEIADNAEWRASQHAQEEVKKEALVATIQRKLQII